MDTSFARLRLFDGPAHYRICVLGHLGEAWMDRLEGMAIKPGIVDCGEPVCTLEGELLDQGALLGVLNTLYSLHLPLLSVDCLTCLSPEFPQG